mmetsp:Transcript_895/g.1218  ORF Transcript_895/g.1218 Transcript_895/m.1218 type:complete len:82 (-) Transcript_895:258-503(-)
MGRQKQINRRRVNPKANGRRNVKLKKESKKFKSPFVKRVSSKKKKRMLHRLAMEKKDIEKKLKEQGIDTSALEIEMKSIEE